MLSHQKKPNSTQSLSCILILGQEKTKSSSIIPPQSRTKNNQIQRNDSPVFRHPKKNQIQIGNFPTLAPKTTKSNSITFLYFGTQQPNPTQSWPHPLAPKTNQIQLNHSPLFWQKKYNHPPYSNQQKRSPTQQFSCISVPEETKSKSIILLILAPPNNNKIQLNHSRIFLHQKRPSPFRSLSRILAPKDNQIQINHSPMLSHQKQPSPIRFLSSGISAPKNNVGG